MANYSVVLIGMLVVSALAAFLPADRAMKIESADGAPLRVKKDAQPMTEWFARPVCM
jgi:hypothetical protein